MTSPHARSNISVIGSTKRAGLLRTITAHVRAYIGRQRLLRENDRIRSDLLTLPDHLLKDIGLSRHHIKYAALDRPGSDRKIVAIGMANGGKADQSAVSGDYCNSFEMRICKTMMP
ncbi:DUF1127 domain-containing protein [Rhizobium leguminosarum]|uniref:DUF1127 domain-containing protein n=1 Tax=Rhizobium leguminosarum TaxID=384 RepID=UPI0013C07E8A|nr:DUF1127 domain-containing protein [Rhizobium leguminosarum]MBY5378336.1 DUF1127 domain-containing protein [Rhizobium leguminosarum]NEH57906.1 DUF1127 domain-containing protein [Rhizobium leguminosarum]